MKFQIECIGQTIEVTGRELRYGWVLEASPMIGWQRKFVRSRGANMALAVGNLKVAITKARDSATVRRLYAQSGLRVVIDNSKPGGG
ncbi:MAG: hypothetical protein E6Q98_15955 [Rhodospirillaceae bacterium]|nr:MAG: hypothetical protein E6Q98_15955 [Rhodospirillaceae bacterium]